MMSYDTAWATMMIQQYLSPGGFVVSLQNCMNEETIAGVVVDPVFGPMVMFGLGGVFVEIVGDVALHSAPVTPEQALQMMRSTRAWPLLNGARGRPAADVGALAQQIAALSRWAAAATRNGNHFWAQISHAGRQTMKPVNPHPKAPSAVTVDLPGGQFGQRIEPPRLAQVQQLGCAQAVMPLAQQRSGGQQRQRQQRARP